MTFERPIKGDLDRALSLLMHDHRHKLMERCSLIKSEAAKAGALHSNRVVVMAIKVADDLHEEAMTQATTILLDFIGRMERPPAEIVAWARPHLENLGNSLLGVVPPNNFPQDHQRLVRQYSTVFGQRLGGILRDVEIGFVKGAGFARAEQVESKEQWIIAAEASRLLKPVFNGEHVARKTICKRAHNGLIRSHAERFMVDDKVHDNREVPKEFWWAEGEAALTQNWTVGDFETWINQEVHLRAFGVSFLRADIEKLLPAGVAEPKAAPLAARGGRISDSEIRGRLLTIFHDRRHNANGWVPASDILLSPEPVDRQVIGGVCQQLADIGLIQWKPGGEGSFIGMAKIRGKGVAAVEAGRSAEIDIRFPPGSAPATDAPAMRDDVPISEAALTEIREVVSAIKAELPELTLSNSVKTDITADINHIEVETDRTTPRRRFMKLYLESLRDDLATAAGIATAGGLVTLAALVGGLLVKHFGIF